MATHPAARYAGPLARRRARRLPPRAPRARRRPVRARRRPPTSRSFREATFTTILVPMKLGEIGEEMVATAVKLAQERGGSVEALHVIKVPLELPLDAPLEDEEARATESIEEAKALGADHGVEVRGSIVRARAIGDAIVKEAGRTGADLIVLGSAPRWRRQSRFFSPTVDYVLKKAPCEVLIVAFPQGVLRRLDRMRDPRDEQYAKLLVETCIDVQPGWQVLVVARVARTPAVRRGLQGDRRARRVRAAARSFHSGSAAPLSWMNDASDELLSKPAPLEEHALLEVDALIAIVAPENTRDARRRRAAADAAAAEGRRARSRSG